MTRINWLGVLVVIVLLASAGVVGLASVGVVHFLQTIGLVH